MHRDQRLTDARLIVIDRDGDSCVRCGVRRDEIHHRYRRGAGGSSHPRIHDPANLVCLCAAHHRAAESLRTDSRELTGLCVVTLTAAFITPVLTTRGWSLPTPGGTWLPICPGYQAPNVDTAQHLGIRYGLIGGTTDHV